MPQTDGGGQVQISSGSHMRTVWLIVVGFIVLATVLVSGIELARSNSDIICSRSFQDTGACTGGSWGQWAISSQSTDQNACTESINESRVYTGLRNTILAAISVSANRHTYCALSDAAFQGGSGTVTSQYSACQIQESRTRVVTGTGTGASCTVSGSSTSTSAGEITSDINTETTGAVDETKTQTINGSYQAYLDLIDARLATSDLSVAPTLVRAGDTTRVGWTASHMKSCVVTSTNGDTWTALNSVVGGEMSSPITQQTTYTLTCSSAIGTQFVSHATVNLVPTFQEQ